MPDVRFCDERFLRDEFIPYLTDPRFVQRCRTDDGVIICETVTEANCTPQTALREVRGRWDWWDHGLALDFTAGPDYNDQLLAPVSWFITRVQMRQFKPIDWQAPEFPGLRGVRVPILLSRHFRGTATVDVFEKAPGRVVLRGRFHGVENHVPGAPLFMAARMHLRAESGTLYWPLPKGTGFRGLLRRLENASAQS